jgi:UDP-2,3-diacylglucosamine hydrolase
MRRHRASRLIHGHTHRPADHPMVIDGLEALRQVLAEWHPDRAEAIVFDGARWRREPIFPTNRIGN